MDLEKKRLIQFFKHKHPLTVIGTNTKEGEIQHNCYNCDSPISGQIFGCSICKIFLHQACSQEGLLLRIRHAFQPTHLLTFQFYSTNIIPHQQFYCAACRKLLFGFIFYCNPCKFELCVDCAFLKPLVTKPATTLHPHLLTFFSKLYRRHRCNSCCGTCNVLVLRCVECDFDLRLRCFSSLPLTIKHECHVDPLTLVTDPDLVESDAGHDEYYCDACEGRRDPKHPVYYCAGCPFVAHVECVFSEVVSSITAQENDSVSVAAEEEEILAVEDCLLDITGDEMMAREFFARLKAKKVKYEQVPGIVNLDQEIEKLEKSIESQTQVVEKMERKLRSLEAELEEDEAQRVALLRSQSLISRFVD